ncbi:MAG: T9SS type A sorting domain-containing protein [Candidatus Pacebacteria bacterium]|nr:T9SS type A sorting domain-containing protein [Candidatus Paceibacterota bacterium]
MKKNIFIVIAMLTSIAFTTKAQENYWDYSWHETNGGPVWSADITEEFNPFILDLDTCTIDNIQYLCAMGIFAVEEENLGNISIERAGIIFYDGSTWRNIRPTTSSVRKYFRFQGDEYIAVADGYIDETYLGGIKKWNGNSWQSAWGTSGASKISYVDIERNRVIFTQLLPALMPDGETLAPHTFVFSYDGLQVDTIGKFRGTGNDYAQIGNRGYITVSPMADEFGGYGKGIYAIDLDSLKFIEYNFTDYPADAVGSIWTQVESNDDETLLFAKEVLGYVAIFDGTTWTEFTEDGNSWTFRSSEEDMIFLGDEGCDYLSFYNGGDFESDSFMASNGLASGQHIIQYQNKWYVSRSNLSETVRLGLYQGGINPNYCMESNIVARWITSEIPSDTVVIPDAISDINMDKIKIYPNPATDKITVESNTVLDNDMRISIYNITGQKMPVDIQIVNDHTISIDVSKLPRGVYSVMSKIIILQ